MPGSNHGPSIKNPKIYEALRRKRGMSKSQAAAISNAMVKKDAGATGLAIPPTGYNATFNQLGITRAARRLKRLKEGKPNWSARAGQTIIGGLSRGGDGKFTSGGGPSDASRRPATRDDRKAHRQARADERAARYAEEDAQEQATRAEEDAYIAAGASGRERQRRRAEIAAKRRERTAARRERRREDAAMEREQRGEEDAADAAQPKGGGGSSGKKKPSPDEKKAEQAKQRAANRAKTAPQAGLSTAEAEALATVAEGGSADGTERLRAMGLVDDTGATDAGRRALNALERGDIRGALAAIQDGKARVERERQRAEDKRQREQDRADNQRRRDQARSDDRRDPRFDLPPDQRGPRAPERRTPSPSKTPDPATETARSRTLANHVIRNLERRRQTRRRAPTTDDRRIGGITNIERRNRSQRKEQRTFSVFKDAAGRDRWLAITTTAYEDKDAEWITRKAIRGVVAAGDSGAPRGPLRFWHVPGLDLGDCDYQASAFDDRMLIESGTFRSKAAARIGQEAARRGYQMSPGFLHTRREPRGGAFDHIALFERSFVPPGRASNPYTRLLTKEARMLTDEKRKEFERLAAEPEARALLESLLSQAETTVKDNDAAGAIYKDAPAWAQALIGRLDALEATVKAPMPPEEMIEAGETEQQDGAEELAAETMDDGAAGLLDDDGFAQLIVDKLIAAIGPMLELEKKMGQWAADIKAAIPTATAQKDDARAQELAALEQRLKALEGEQPRQARLAGQVWEGLTGMQISPAQAAQITAKEAPGGAPPGLSAQEQGAYQLIYGDQ